MAAEIKFGTDGWRGIIADDFTFENIRRVGNAIAAYVHKNEDASKGLVVGYDTRFLSQRAAEIISDVLASTGIAVRLSDDLHANSGIVLCGEAPWDGRRSHDYLQPQSFQLEWRQVQSLVWRIRYTRHHEIHRGRIGRAANRAQGRQRNAGGLQNRLHRSHQELC